jgi:hypothetical protein
VGEGDTSCLAYTDCKNDCERPESKAPQRHEIKISWKFVATVSWRTTRQLSHHAPAIRGADMRRRQCPKLLNPYTVIIFCDAPTQQPTLPSGMAFLARGSGSRNSR